MLYGLRGKDILTIGSHNGGSRHLPAGHFSGTLAVQGFYRSLRGEEFIAMIFLAFASCTSVQYIIQSVPYDRIKFLSCTNFAECLGSQSDEADPGQLRHSTPSAHPRASNSETNMHLRA